MIGKPDDGTAALQPAASDGEDAKEGEDWGGFFKFLLKLVAAVVLFRTLLFAPFTIPSESMLPTLWKGDYLVASKWSYGYSDLSLPFQAPLIPGRVLADLPERGDVAIFKHPVDGTDYVKRVIGLPGDTVAVRGGRVVLNGEMLPQERLGDFVQPVDPHMRRAQEERRRLGQPSHTPCAWGADEGSDANGVQVCRYRLARETLPSGRSYTVLDFGLTPQDDFDPVVVPRGRLFVLGDNRDNSQDSRFAARARGGVGLVPTDMLVGRAAMVLWSTDGGAEWIKPWTWFSAARWDRIGEGL